MVSLLLLHFFRRRRALQLEEVSGHGLPLEKFAKENGFFHVGELTQESPYALDVRKGLGHLVNEL